MFQSMLLQNIIHGIDPIHAKTIHLKQGQIFKGIVTKIYPGELAQLKLGSLVLTAKLETPLEKGKPYLLQVTGGDNVPRLKVLENISLYENKNMKGQVLQQMGIQDGNKNTEMLVQKLMDGHIPFTSKEIREGSTLLQQLNVSNVDTINVMVQMIKKGLPLTKETYLSMVSLLSNQSIGEGILTLEQGLKEYNLHNQFSSLYGVLQNLTKDSQIEQILQMSSGNNANQLLHGILSQLGLHYENLLQKNFQLDTTLQYRNMLKPLLIDFLNQTTGQFLTIRKDAEFLLHRFTGNQLLSMENQGPLQNIVMQIPLFFMGKNRDITVQWQGRKKENGTIDSDYCRILFYLEMAYLSETVIDLQIQNRIVSLTIYNENDKPEDFQNHWFFVLKKQLDSLDYRLSSVKWNEPHKVVSDNKYERKSNIYTDKNDSVIGVDVRI
ncbi:hypothetical protein QA612_11980 [Evansella sp. AB-P1]|uniref:hypothetical protein n=1 Tax=Evansella sp. AB-P1 TaxID=3037653 RepID=UPI00241EBB17|nr:hypothetical protein [Evansella sp. AB-P1]MDG5788208.1 hypothetical protein [Evansella sp. AB-P1]